MGTSTIDGRTAADPFVLAQSDDGLRLRPQTHMISRKHGIRCGTEEMGHPTPGGLTPLELVLDASEGFIPLWDRDVTLRWQFASGTLDKFQDPAAAGAAIETLFGQAILAWGDAAPIRFARRADAWDFEIVVRPSDDCEGGGCVLASAFFPDAGRHKLDIYPMMFRQPEQERIETLTHEIGHVFGLRHFFALIKEQKWAAEMFGEQDPFTIMNYGDKSVLTEKDKADLKRLYQLVWSGQLTKINGTPIRLVRPYHEIPTQPAAIAVAAARA